jgi:hypothetical protein
MHGSVVRTCMRRRERRDPGRRQCRGPSISGGEVTLGRDSGSAALAWPRDGHLADQSRERDPRPASGSASPTRLSQPRRSDYGRPAGRRTSRLRPLRRSGVDLEPRGCDASSRSAKRDTGACPPRRSRSVSEGKVPARRHSSTAIVARPRDCHPTASHREGDPTPAPTSSTDFLSQVVHALRHYSGRTRLHLWRVQSSQVAAAPEVADASRRFGLTTGRRPTARPRWPARSCAWRFRRPSGRPARARSGACPPAP